MWCSIREYKFDIMQCNCFIIMMSNVRFLIKNTMESKYILIIVPGNNKNKKSFI